MHRFWFYTSKIKIIHNKKGRLKKKERMENRMLTKEKVLYQVKLILDCLPEEEYNLIPQKYIDYIEDNFEYDENISIDSELPLENQNIDEQTYEILDEIMKNIESTKTNRSLEKNNMKPEVAEYVKKIKESNKNYETKIENIQLNNLIEILKKENSKIPKAKELLEEYKKALKQKDEEIIRLRENNQYLYKNIQKIPKVVRRFFIKDIETKLLK